jgi:hypothetical protein
MARLSLFFVTFLFFIGAFQDRSIAEPNGDDRMRNGRMNACVRILQKSDKDLQNSWRGHCGLEEIEQEVDNNPTPQETELKSVFSIKSSPLTTSVDSCVNSVHTVATGPKCGLASPSLYSNLADGVAIKIRLPNNQCGAFIPVLITNKTDFACNAVQTRIACVDVSRDDAADTTTIKFSTRRTGNSDGVTIKVDAAGLSAHGGRLDELIPHPQFTLLPAFDNTDDVAKKLRDATKSQETKCVQRGAHSPSNCATRAAFQADANMQETMRRYRNPKHDSAKSDITNDGIVLVNFLKTNHVHDNQEQWMLFLSIAMNEVGLSIKNGQVSTYDPIYAVSDAVKGNSGLSFGAHQIDLGANEDRELKLFWDVIDAYNAEHPEATLQMAEDRKDCVDLPLRLMTASALALTYQAAPRMTYALRSAEGLKEYNTRLLAYLKDETAKTDAKAGLFRNSMITRICLQISKTRLEAASR